MEMDHVTVQGTFIYKDGWHQNIYYLCGKKYKHRIAYYMGSPSNPNIAEALVDSNGYLPEQSSPDGIHISKKYCEKWLEYLKNNS